MCKNWIIFIWLQKNACKSNNRDGLYETYEKLIENNKNQIYPKYKHSIEVKEESTNTCFNENNNYPELDNLKLNSFELNKNNTQEGKIFQLKTTVHKNNFIDFNDNHDNIFNKTQNKEFKKKSNNIINISINNNINFNSETNKNKYYLDLFNFRLIQSFIQNRSNYFKLKNKNIFGLYPTHYQTPDNFSFLLNIHPNFFVNASSFIFYIYFWNNIIFTFIIFIFSIYIF